MKTGWLMACVGLALVPASRAADDFIDPVEDALAFSCLQDAVRFRVSGLLDLEAYRYQLPAPGLIYSESTSLLNPRLSLFLDGQIGREVYVFAQTRVDRGFDAGDEKLGARFDEYAVRYSVNGEAWLNLQVGKFATVVGSWVERHDSWENPFVTAPLAYESLTGVWDSRGAGSADTLLQWAHRRPGGLADGSKDDKDHRLPVIWGPSYGSGVAVSGLVSSFQYAFEIKNAALSSRPDYWDAAHQQWQNPTFSGRVGFRPNEAWNLGLSASSGCYLAPDATVPAGSKPGDYREVVIGQDTSFAWHYFQLWTEVYWARFQIPRVGHADVLSYYAEAKYQFTPQFFGAVRWNQQLYGNVRDGAGQEVPWGDGIWRLDVAPAYRFTPHVQLKLQYSLQYEENPARRWNHILAAQATLRF